MITCACDIGRVTMLEDTDCLVVLGINIGEQLALIVSLMISLMFVISTAIFSACTVPFPA